MKKYTLSDDDIDAFREAVQDVKPLKQQNRVEFSKKKTAKRLHVQSNQFDESVEDFLSDHISTTVHADEKLFFAHSGLQHKILRDLRQGKIFPADSIDLHKMTVIQARTIVTEFLAESLAAGYRCVHIIHGKGKLNVDAPILKNHVNSWLQQHPDILAFCSAAPRDGGVGAVYILLRRQKLD